MKLKDYIATVINAFSEAESKEVAGVIELAFDIGLNNDATVNLESGNRIKFTLLVGRE